MFKKFVLLFLLALAALFLTTVSPLAAATTGSVWNVNSNLDEPDAAKTDNACLSAPSNKCTLRAAIMQSNASGDTDTIVLQPNTKYTLTLGGAGENHTATGDLDIIYSVNIEGSATTRTTIDGNDTDRVFHIWSTTAHVNISKLTIQNGNMDGGTGGDRGGGIFNAGYLTLTDVLITGNDVTEDGGGIYNLGGDVKLIESTVSSNTANVGAGMYSGLEGSITVLRSTIHNNHAADEGGGIFIEEGDGTIASSTISNNLADINGGGIAMRSAPPYDHSLRIYNVTVAFNRADADDDGLGEAAGMVQLGGITYMKNTIFAENRRGTVTGKLDDCYGDVHLFNYNLFQEPTVHCVFENDNATNKKGVNPLLGALANNGGLTLTHALLPNSPAIDAGNPDGCKDQYNYGITIDQRGEPRTVNGNPGGVAVCDMGAFRYNPNPPVSPTPVLCNTKPNKPSLASPVNNAHPNTHKVMLNWSSVTCASKYQVIVRQGSKTGPLADSKQVTDSQYKTKSLSKPNTYYWRVKACNTFGCRKSASWHFTLQ